MDNIQKSIIAVLGIAAFATIIVPDNFGSPPKTAPAPKVAEAAPPPPPPPPQEDNDPNSEFASQGGEVEEPDEFASFGQPMNDAAPLGADGVGGGGWGEGPQQAQARARENPAPPPAATVSNGPGAPPGLVDGGAN